jgi:acetyl esterase/lipase
VTVEAYGPGADRFGELWRPAGDGPWPVVVLLHGGFWRAQRTLELMRPLAADLAGRGFAAWNLEYRRVGQPGGGWPGTCEDVAAGLDHLARLAGREPLDLDRLVVAGHSAGGHLALWSASRAGLPAGAPGAGPLVAPRLVVSLAGVCDLHAGAAGGIGEGAVAEFLGASPDQAPSATGSPPPWPACPWASPSSWSTATPTPGCRWSRAAPTPRPRPPPATPSSWSSCPASTTWP